MSTYTLYKVVEDREIDIPDKCPRCGAGFTGAGSSLVEWDWHDVGGHVDITSGDFEQGMSKDGDAFFPCSFWCSDCSWNTEEAQP